MITYSPIYIVPFMINVKIMHKKIGISVGITSMVVPLYQSEIAPKEIRGRIVAVQQWSITWGIMLSYVFIMTLFKFISAL